MEGQFQNKTPTDQKNVKIVVKKINLSLLKKYSQPDSYLYKKFGEYHLVTMENNEFYLKSDEVKNNELPTLHLVLDVSGSMDGAPIKHAVASIRNLLDEVGKCFDQIWLIKFNYDAEIKEIKTSADVRQISGGGSTDFNPANDCLMKSLSKISSHGKDKHVVIYFTDGDGPCDLVEMRKKVLAFGDSNSICFHTIGFGNVKEELLMALTELSNLPGTYNSIKHSDEIQLIIENVGRVASNARSYILKNTLTGEKIVCSNIGSPLVPSKKLSELRGWECDGTPIEISESVELNFNEIINALETLLEHLMCELESADSTTEGAITIINEFHDLVQCAFNETTQESITIHKFEQMNSFKKVLNELKAKWQTETIVGLKKIIYARLDKFESRLNQRTVQNEELFINNQSKLSKMAHELDERTVDELDKLSESCPYGQSLISLQKPGELNKKGDCMVLPIKVSRNSIGTVDPSRVHIKSVMYGCSLSYSDFIKAIIQKINEGVPEVNIHGGFEENKKAFVLDLFNDEIGCNSAFPLYLHPVHAKFAYLNMPPLLGFTLTLDPFGYFKMYTSHFPFKLLFKIAIDVNYDPRSEIKNQTLQDVKNMCEYILAQAQFRDTLKYIDVEAFAGLPKNRTKNLIPCLDTLLSHLSFNTNELNKIKNNVDLKRRFVLSWYEENLRRWMLKLFSDYFYEAKLDETNKHINKTTKKLEQNNNDKEDEDRSRKILKIDLLNNQLKSWPTTVEVESLKKEIYEYLDDLNCDDKERKKKLDDDVFIEDWIRKKVKLIDIKNTTTNNNSHNALEEACFDAHVKTIKSAGFVFMSNLFDKNEQDKINTVEHIIGNVSNLQSTAIAHQCLLYGNTNEKWRVHPHIFISDDEVALTYLNNEIIKLMKSEIVSTLNGWLANKAKYILDTTIANFFTCDFNQIELFAPKFVGRKFGSYFKYFRSEEKNTIKYKNLTDKLIWLMRNKYYDTPKPAGEDLSYRTNRIAEYSWPISEKTFIFLKAVIKRHDPEGLILFNKNYEEHKKQIEQNNSNKFQKPQNVVGGKKEPARVEISIEKINPFENHQLAKDLNARQLRRVKENWRTTQNEIKLEISHKDDAKLFNVNEAGLVDFSNIKLIGAFDMSFKKKSREACVVLVVFKIEEDCVEICYISKLLTHITEPYIPSFLAFRELPGYQKVWDKIPPEFKPQVVFFDGFGKLHPNECGLASHFGAKNDVCTVGVAKTMYFMDKFPWKKEKTIIEFLQAKNIKNINDSLPIRACFRLEDLDNDNAGELYGYCIMCSNKSKRPTYISVGNKISNETALNLVKHLNNLWLKQRHPTKEFPYILEADRIGREFIKTRTNNVVDIPTPVSDDDNARYSGVDSDDEYEMSD